MSRLEILQAALEGDCTHNCNGRWLTMAKDILDRNGITQTEFGAAVHELLDKGRGKYRNIFLKGGANRGKTFLLNPLTVIYKTFVNLRAHHLLGWAPKTLKSSFSTILGGLHKCYLGKTCFYY